MPSSTRLQSEDIGARRGEVKRGEIQSGTRSMTTPGAANRYVKFQPSQTQGQFWRYRLPSSEGMSKVEDVVEVGVSDVYLISEWCE